MSQRDGEALPDVDDSVKQPVLGVGVRDHALLLLQGLHTSSIAFYLPHNNQRRNKLARGITDPKQEMRLDRHTDFLGALLHLREEKLPWDRSSQDKDNALWLEGASHRMRLSPWSFPRLPRSSPQWRSPEPGGHMTPCWWSWRDDFSTRRWFQPPSPPCKRKANNEYPYTWRS